MFTTKTVHFIFFFHESRSKLNYNAQFDKEVYDYELCVSCNKGAHILNKLTDKLIR